MGSTSFYPSLPQHPLDSSGATFRLELMSAIEATRGDQSSGYHIYSLTAFQCPLAIESRVCNHHCFVRSNPDSGGGSSDLPLDSQSKLSAIFYALDSGRGLCHPGRSPCRWPRLAQSPAITALRAVGRFQGFKVQGVSLMQGFSPQVAPITLTLLNHH